MVPKLWVVQLHLAVQWSCFLVPKLWGVQLHLAVQWSCFVAQKVWVVQLHLAVQWSCFVVTKLWVVQLHLAVDMILDFAKPESSAVQLNLLELHSRLSGLVLFVSKSAVDVLRGKLPH